MQNCNACTHERARMHAHARTNAPHTLAREHMYTHTNQLLAILEKLLGCLVGHELGAVCRHKVSLHGSGIDRDFAARDRHYFYLPGAPKACAKHTCDDDASARGKTALWPVTKRLRRAWRADGMLCQFGREGRRAWRAGCGSPATFPASPCKGDEGFVGCTYCTYTSWPAPVNT